jgi:Asp-tRNA(Asn)/Glu-tRNA(Gln) amidotransferase A subunit family amidase
VQIADYTSTLNRGVDRLRVAVVQNWYFDRINGFVAEAIEEAASVLEDLGAWVNELEVPHLELSRAIHHTLLAS